MESSSIVIEKLSIDETATSTEDTSGEPVENWEGEGSSIAVTDVSDVTTEEELLLRTKVQEARAMLSSEVNGLCPDWRIRKYILAKQHDLSKAVPMINDWATWWTAPLTASTTLTPQEMSERVAFEDDPKEQLYRETMPQSYQGESVHGCAIFWEKLGAISKSLPRVFSEVSEDDIYIRHVRINERMFKKVHEKSERDSKPMGKIVVVFDLKGIPMIPSSAGMRMMRRHIATDEAYYVESLQTLLVINAPIYFTAIWAIVKPWLDANTVDKIRIFGSNFLEGMKAVIPEDQIPVEYGGSREDFYWTYPENFNN